MSFKDFDHLKIGLEDIKLATNNFDPEKRIGHGGFGPVYKGELSLSQGGRPTMLAFKRLDSKYGQGNDEFWKEIIMLSKYKHENLISLQCFCDEGDERILGYEYASRGSLDSYLADTSLTWAQRITICIGVARALNYLHDPKDTHERVLHRDIKSSNILLDEHWNAKVSDFGLSKFGPANQAETHVYSKVVGTPGYCDPLYMELGFLTKESDVYSFGVVLYEVMCGKLCCEYSNGRLSGILVPMWKHHYDENKLDDIVCHHLKEQQVEADSLMTFAAIASECLNKNRKERPTMLEIIKQLEVALELQNSRQDGSYFVELGKLATPPLSYESQEKLLLLLSKGFRYEDSTWLSINKNRRVCEIIAATKCITAQGGGNLEVISRADSRFGHVLVNDGDFRIEVSTQFLVPHVTYIMNLIYKPKRWDYGNCLPFKYKRDEETHYSGPFVVELREDGWFTTQLYQFTCSQREQRFSIDCLGIDPRIPDRALEGLEFRPLEHVIDDKRESFRSVSSTDTIWEQKFPIEYIDLIKLSKEKLEWTTKKELYLLLRQGFLIDDDGEKWFSIDRSMKKRLMIPAKKFLSEANWIWKSFPESRFEVVAESPVQKKFFMDCKIKSQLLSPKTTYSCHLIYKLPQDYSPLESIVEIGALSNRNFFDDYWYVYLIPSHTPIIGAKIDEKSNVSRKVEGHPKLRKDGWMECQFWKAVTSSSRNFRLYFVFNSHHKEKNEMKFTGLVVQGIEFRPL